MSCAPPLRITRVSDSTLQAIPQGPNIGPLLPPDGSCVQASDANVWLIQSGQGRGIVGEDELRSPPPDHASLGFNAASNTARAEHRPAPPTGWIVCAGERRQCLVDSERSGARDRGRR